MFRVVLKASSAKHTQCVEISLSNSSTQQMWYCDCGQHNCPPRACPCKGEYRKSGSVGHINCTKKKGFKAIRTHVNTNSNSGDHCTHAHSMSTTLLSPHLKSKRRKCLCYFANGKSINLIALKASFTNSNCIKTIQIHEKKVT